MSGRKHDGPNGHSCKIRDNGRPCVSCLHQTNHRFIHSLQGGSHCMTCNGYYGSSHGQPVCPTCHAFLYANDIDEEVNLQLLSEERRQRNGDDSDRDSGNEEMDAAGAGGAAQLPLQAQEPREQHPDQEFNPDLSKFFRKKIRQKNNFSLIQCTSSITKKNIRYYIRVISRHFLFRENARQYC